MEKMFLVEQGKYIVLRYGDKEISFSSIEDFNRYYPEVNLSGKVYLDYEPYRQIYIDSTLGVNIWNGLVPKYEIALAKVPLVLLNKEDLYFDLSLDEAKKVKCQEIKKLYTKEIEKGCLTSSGVRYNCGDVDRANIVSAVLMMQLSSAQQIQFIDYDNVKQLLTLPELVTMGLEVAQYFTSLLYRKNSLYNVVNSAIDIDAVKIIDWNTSIE